jgi:hypothetical protein
VNRSNLEIVRELCRCVEQGIDRQTEDDLDFLREHFDAVEALRLSGRLGPRRDAAVANCLFQRQKAGRLAPRGALLAHFGAEPVIRGVSIF